MHQLLPLKVKIILVLAVAVLVAWAAHRLGMPPLPTGAFIGVVEILLLILLTHSWSLAVTLPLPKPGWINTDLTGAWSGTITSQWQGDAANPQPVTIPAQMKIRQGWHDMAMVLHTDKMYGPSTGAIPRYNALTRELEIKYFYETFPTAAHSANNPPQQHGCATARINMASPDTMTIRYTNERGQGGDITLSRSKPMAKTLKNRRVKK